MRVIPSIRTVCCLSLMVAAPAVPAMAAAIQLDSGTGLQASKEVATPPPARGQSDAAVRRSRKSEAQALRSGVGAPATNRSGKAAPP